MKKSREKSYFSEPFGVLPPKGNASSLDSWENDGKPFNIPDLKPKNRWQDLDGITKQRNQIDELDIKEENPLRGIDPKYIAHKASGNQAPSLPLELRANVIEDTVESTGIPENMFNAAYARGNMLKYIQDSEKYQKAGADFERVVDRTPTDEEIQAEKAKFMLLKGRSLNLPEWDWRSFPPDGTAVFFGRRRSGKSFLVRWLIYNYRHVYRGVIVLTNTEQNAFWSQHVPHRLIHKYDPFVVQGIIDHQKAILAQNELNANDPAKLINPYIAVVLDDVVAGNLHHDSPLNTLFYEGRHNKIAVFITTQYPKALPPGVRSNADLACIFPQWSENEIEAIQKQYCNFFESEEDFYLTVQKYTQNRSSLIIALGDPTVKQINSTYWYKAEEPPPFITGSKEFWKNDAEYYRKKLERLASTLTSSNTDVLQAKAAFSFITNPNADEDAWINNLFS